MEMFEINAFVKIVQSGSYTEAAKQLNTQKSYLSRVITNLESKLQVRLIERNTRKLTLTNIGQQIYLRCLQIVESTNEALSLAHIEQGEPQGTLKITCGTEFGLMFMNDWIYDYARKFPKVKMDVLMTNDLVDLVQEGFDLAIRLGELEDSSLFAKPLGKMQYGLFASSNYLKNSPALKHPDDLQNHQCIVFSSGAKHKWEFFKDKERIQVTVDGNLHMNNIFAVAKAAEQDFGIAKLPLVLPQLKQSPLKRLLIDWEIASVPVNILFPNARHLTPKVRHFIEIVSATSKVKLAAIE